MPNADDGSPQKPSLWEKTRQFLRKENNLQLVIFGVAGVALVVFLLSTSFQPSGGPQQDSPDDLQPVALYGDTATQMEQKLAAILSQVQNAGRVDVMITLASQEEIVPAMSVDTREDTSEGSGSGSQNRTTSTQENREPMVVQGKNGTEPLVLTKKAPKVLGVLVVAEGAIDLDVRIKLMNAVQVALQLPPSQIEVLPKNITNNKEGN